MAIQVVFVGDSYFRRYNDDIMADKEIMELRKYLLPPDVFFRHLLVARELEKIPDLMTVLDVGGSLGELRKFRNDLNVVTADVIGGDVIYGGDKLPFKNNSFDAVVSIDTLEHVPHFKRVELVAEWLRVAKDILVVIAPYASPAHLKHESKLKKDYENKGKKIPGYLEEHLKYGLVTDEQIDDVVKRYNLSSKLVGNVVADNLNFAVHMFEISPGKLNKSLYLMKFGWNLAMNLFLTFVTVSGGKENASRVVLTCSK